MATLRAGHASRHCDLVSGSIATPTPGTRLLPNTNLTPSRTGNTATSPLQHIPDHTLLTGSKSRGATYSTILLTIRYRHECGCYGWVLVNWGVLGDRAGGWVDG